MFKTILKNIHTLVLHGLVVQSHDYISCNTSQLLWVQFSSVFRKREEEQRRREAVQQVSVATVEKRKAPLVRAEPEKLSLENLTMDDAVLEVKKSSKAERTKSKEERHKGTRVHKCLKLR